MSIYEFVTQDELDGLSEDHRVAFMELVNTAQRKLAAKIDVLDPENQYEWQKAEELRYTFMNVVVAAAKQFEVEPFYSMQVPIFQQYRDTDHRQFRADLDHYITQLVLGNSARSKQDSVKVLPKTKEQIRTYVVGLRECIETGKIDANRRDALLKKLDALEHELNKTRLNMMDVARVAYFVLSIPATMWGSAQVVEKLTTHLMQTVAEAKAEEDETKLLVEAARPIPLSPPREPLLAKKPSPFDDLDDDVPF